MMKISTSILIQQILSEKIMQLETDITAYKTTFKDAPRAAEVIEQLTAKHNECAMAKADFQTVFCSCSYDNTYSPWSAVNKASDRLRLADEALKSALKDEAHKRIQERTQHICSDENMSKAVSIVNNRHSLDADTYGLVTRRGIKVGERTIYHPVLIAHVGAIVKVTAHSVYSMSDDKICDY